MITLGLKSCHRTLLKLFPLTANLSPVSALHPVSITSWEPLPSVRLKLHCSFDAQPTRPQLFSFTRLTTLLIHSLFVVTKRVDGASLLELSFFLFTTSTTGLSTRIDENLNALNERAKNLKKTLNAYLQK